MFAYTAILAAVLPGLCAGRRARALAGSVAGLVVTAASVLAPSDVLLHGWLLPPLLLLLAYWTSGLLFTAPMPRAEQALLQIDHVLRVRAISSAAPRWIAELLEFSYAAVYALIPVALTLHLRFTASPDYDRFWTVILVTDYVCFAVLPWIQTRPPRALEPDDPWRSSLRAFNLRAAGCREHSRQHLPKRPRGRGAGRRIARVECSLRPWSPGCCSMHSRSRRAPCLAAITMRLTPSPAGWWPLRSGRLG